MAFLDILRSRKREETKPQRLQKGAFSPKANRPLAEKKPAKKQVRLKAVPHEEKVEKKTPVPPENKNKKTTESKSALAAEFLLRPHITEKSTNMANQGIYTFKVLSSANKIIIKKAFQEMYGFEPVKVRMVNTPPKKRKVRGKIGVKPGFKKALVYLKEDDKIEIGRAHV